MSGDLTRYLRISENSRLEYEEIIYDFTKTKTLLGRLALKEAQKQDLTKSLAIYLVSTDHRIYVFNICYNIQQYTQLYFDLYYLHVGGFQDTSGLGKIEKIKTKHYLNDNLLDVIIICEHLDHLIKVDTENSMILFNSQVEKELNL